MSFINFHCHNTSALAGGLGVISIDPTTEAVQTASSAKYTTVGIHPWSTLNSDVHGSLLKLADFCSAENVVGIGEIGLDRLKGAPLQVQELIFKQQIEVAMGLHKPIVVHCVRAWSELFKITSDSRYSEVEKAVHGFRRQPEIAHQLVENGFYVSFGTLLVDPTPELSEALTAVPLSRMLFETDTSEMPIGEVYAAASDILNIPIEQLEYQIESNFMDFFGVDFL